MVECLQCGRRGGGTEGCGSGWFHGRRKDVALDVGRVGLTIFLGKSGNLKTRGNARKFLEKHPAENVTKSRQSLEHS